MVSPTDLKVRLAGIGEIWVVAHPIWEGPSVESCDGRIWVTPVAQGFGL